MKSKKESRDIHTVISEHSFGRDGVPWRGICYEWL